MDCLRCGSAATTERPERAARGSRRFRCRDCGHQLKERSGGRLDRAVRAPLRRQTLFAPEHGTPAVP